MYSIGTPSTSDENLFEDVKGQTDDSKPIGISREVPLRDDAPLKILRQGKNDKDLHGDLTDISISGQLEAAAEVTKLDKSLQRLEGTGDIVESAKFLDSIESPPEIPNVNRNDSFAVTSYSMSSGAGDSAFQPESNERVNQNKEHELKQATGQLNSATDLDRCNLDLSQGSVQSLCGASEKLRIALQHLKSQLTALR